jgi:tetratricopeptide (TPR) repeat protein
MLLAPAIEAQTTDYRTLWQRGAYAEAIQVLETRFEQLSYRPRTMRREFAELLFTVGRIDEAIEVLEGLAMSAIDPATMVRLAQLYRYRGRIDDFDGIVRLTEQQLQSLSNYRRGRDDMLALGQLMVLKGEDPRAILRHFSTVTNAFPTYDEAFVAAGDLALSKRAYDVAEREYSQALRVNVENQDALVGLAQCYYHASDPRAEDVMASLQTMNPNHPQLRLLHVEQFLDLGQADEALTVLDSVTMINPNHLDALALKAAAFFLKDDSTRVTQLREEMFAVNPSFSGAYRIPGRLASRHYRFQEGRRFQLAALKVDANDHEARLLLAFDLLRLGNDAEARGELERVFAVDPYSVRAYNLLEAADAIDAFTTIDRGIFRLQLPEYEAKLMGDDLLALLDEISTLYQEKYKITLKVPVVVQVFDDHDVFMVRSVGLPGSAGHLGICFGQLVTMDSPRARPLGTMNWRQVLWHEFVHVITLQKTNNRMPRWLSEGISVYEEYAGDLAWGQRLDPNFKTVVDEVGYPSLEDLNRLFTSPNSATQLMFGYFSAGEFVKFYVDAYGHDALVRVLDRIGEGEDATDALVTASQESLDELNLRFDAHMRVRCSAFNQLAEHSVFKMVLADGDEAAKRGDLEAAERAYLSAFELYPDYVAEDAPLHRLVNLYANSGDRVQYIKALRRLVDWDATANETCVKLATLLIEEGDAKAALDVLDRAFAVHPFQVAMLKQRVLAAQQLGDLTHAQANLKKLVYLDLPERAEHQLNLARVLAKQGDRVAAKAEVIALLETVPHFWDAQQLLLDLVEGEQ